MSPILNIFAYMDKAVTDRSVTALRSFFWLGSLEAILIGYSAFFLRFLL